MATFTSLMAVKVPRCFQLVHSTASAKYRRSPTCERLNQHSYKQMLLFSANSGDCPIQHCLSQRQNYWSVIYWDVPYRFSCFNKKQHVHDTLLHKVRDGIIEADSSLSRQLQKRSDKSPGRLHRKSPCIPIGPTQQCTSWAQLVPPRG